MTYPGNRTIRLTAEELTALPDWHQPNRLEMEGAMFKTTSTSGDRSSVVVEFIRQPPAFTLEQAWYQVVITGGQQ